MSPPYLTIVRNKHPYNDSCALRFVTIQLDNKSIKILIMKVKISEIVVGKRMRQINENSVDTLVDGFLAIGQLTPIQIVVSKSGGYILVAGNHRIHAAKKLNWIEIDANILILTELQCKLAEIDENLLRNDLTLLERAEHLAKRKEIYLELFPETKAGTAGEKASSEARKATNAKTAFVASFTKSTSYTTGASIRQIEIDVKRATDILPDVRDIIRDYSIANIGVELDTLASLPACQQQEFAKRLLDGEVETVSEYMRVIKAEENDEVRTFANSIVLPKRKYRCIVIDPPWDMARIEREIRPNGFGWDYPTMTDDEIMEFDVASLAHEKCHIYLWTTQKYIPLAFKVLEKWGFPYMFTMVWHKPGGFQPYGLPQYNCEFVLFGRLGGLSFLDLKAFNMCFNGPRRECGRKPDEFYDLVRRVSPGPRIDVFSRENREGFETWGAESGKFIAGN